MDKKIPGGERLRSVRRSCRRAHFLITVSTMVMNRASIRTEFYHSHGKFMTCWTGLNEEVLFQEVAEHLLRLFDLPEETLPLQPTVDYKENPGYKRYSPPEHFH